MGLRPKPLTEIFRRVLVRKEGSLSFFKKKKSCLSSKNPNILFKGAGEKGSLSFLRQKKLREKLQSLLIDPALEEDTLRNLFLRVAIEAETV